MTASATQLVADIIDDLKKQRDEISLQLHLGKQELKSEFQSLGKRLDELDQQYQPLRAAVKETGDGVVDALRLVADEIKEGFFRIRKSLQ